ncbi:MAG: amidohydrolase [Polyangiaceae bacterium]|nr:amidohydrolase [Polyangiaceae bacterium]
MKRSGKLRRGLAQAALAALAGACTPAAPAGHPEAGSTAVAPVPVPDAPWRTPASEAAGQEPATDSPPVLIRGAKLYLGDGTVLARGHVLLEGGKIRAVGAGDGVAPAGARVVDAAGKFVTPGLIDVHSHIGVYPHPFVKAHEDGNEAVEPVTAGVRALDGFWPQDPSIERAVAGGVTTMQVLPGSANLIGGRTVTLKLRRASTGRAMHFAGAPDGLKMACGENPKRVYGDKGRAPQTRMGNVAGQRAAFLSARRLIDEWDSWRTNEAHRRAKAARELERYRGEQRERDAAERACREGDDDACAAIRGKKPPEAPEPSEPALPPRRDLQQETLAGVLEGKILLHVHCYRADDMADVLALADEVGAPVRAFHHALEAYKIRGELARRGVAVATWADWWGFKMEALDGIPENLALVEAAAGRAVVHSDSEEGIRRLNQEASKGLASGRRAGLALTEEGAMRWITQNPAWVLGVEDRVGTLAVGKDADVVVWDADPFSVYARAALVFIDGLERYDAAHPGAPWSDFEAGADEPPLEKAEPSPPALPAPKGTEEDQQP